MCGTCRNGCANNDRPASGRVPLAPAEVNISVAQQPRVLAFFDAFSSNRTEADDGVYDHPAGAHRRESKHLSRTPDTLDMSSHISYRSSTIPTTHTQRTYTILSAAYPGCLPRPRMIPKLHFPNTPQAIPSLQRSITALCCELNGGPMGSAIIEYGIPLMPIGEAICGIPACPYIALCCCCI